MAAAALNGRARVAADRSLQWSLAGHGLLLVLVLIGGFSLPHDPPPTQLAIKATVVESPTNRRARTAPVPRPEPKVEPKVEPKANPKPEPKPEPKAKPKPEPKPDPAIAQRKAEQLKQEKEKEKAVAQAKRQEAQREKQKAEQAAAEKQKAEREKAEEARRKAAEESAARERDRELEEEERLLAATDSGALADYVAVIRQKVERNWVRPPGAKPGLECEVLVTQIPGGEVAAVQMGRCNADDTVRRSIEAAVLRASPLPPPDDPTLFERNLRFTFKPEQ